MIMITKKSLIAGIMSVVTAISLSGSAFAFLDDVDDVPVKDIMAEESTAGEFSGDNIIAAYKLLNYIDCITEPQEEFEENITVTKAYAAQALAVVASGYREEAVGTVPYSDVGAAHEYAAGISQAFGRGIITAGDKFYPNKSISASELADMAIRALKYDYIYINQSALERAIDLGFFKGVEYSGDSITRGQFMLFLCNVLDADYITVSGLDNLGVASVSVVDGVSHLQKYFDIYKQDGIVTGYKYSSVNGDADLDDDVIQINRGSFKIAGDVTMDYVGVYVDAYVDTENDNLVVSMLKNPKKMHFYSFFKNAFDGADANQINFYEETHKRRVAVSDSAVVMSNNTYYGLYSRLDNMDILKKADRIVLIDNDGDNTADIVKAEKYTYYIIKTVSVDKETIVFDKNGGMLEITDSSWVEFSFEGQRLELKSLKTNDVLTVLESVRKDGSRVFSGEISRKIEEGTIKNIGNDEYFGEYYEAGNERYYLTDEFIRYMDSVKSEKKPKVGNFVRLYVSSDNKVVASMSEDDFSYGYIMSGVVDEDEEVVRLNVYNLTGEVGTYYFADKVKVYNNDNINGIKKEKMVAAGLYSGIAGSGRGSYKLTTDVVAYSLDAEGKVSAIAKPIDRTDTTKYPHGSLYYPLTLDYDGTNEGDRYFLSRIYREVYASKYKIMSSIPILVLPEDDSLKSNEKAYGIKHSTSWGAEGKKVNGLAFKIYNCDKFYVPQFCTMIDKVELTMDQGNYGECYMYPIESINQSLDEDDLEITQISYYHNGELKQSTISPDVEFVNVGVFSAVDSVNKLKKGDVVQIKTNSLGEIYLIRVLFSLQSRPEKFSAYFEDGNVTEEIESKDALGMTLLYGRIEDIKDDVALINTSNDGTNSKYTRPVVIGNSVYKAVFYNIYDTKSNKVTAGSLAEIQPGDIVLMRRYYNSIQDVIIIR